VDRFTRGKRLAGRAVTHGLFCQRAAAAFRASCLTNRLPKYLRLFLPPRAAIFRMWRIDSSLCTAPVRTYCDWRGVVWRSSFSTAALSSTSTPRTAKAPKNGPTLIAPNRRICCGPNNFCAYRAGRPLKLSHCSPERMPSDRRAHRLRHIRADAGRVGTERGHR